jgi:hypothetical protein
MEEVRLLTPPPISKIFKYANQNLNWLVPLIRSNMSNLHVKGINSIKKILELPKHVLIIYSVL